MSIFKTCDIRGVYGKELDEDTAYLLGRAIATEMEGATLAVGGDLRPSTPALQGALIQGLERSGARVLDLGRVPTPAYYFGIDHLGADGGIMVTASHNPPGYNGFKPVLGLLPITHEHLLKLARDMKAGRFVNRNGTRRRIEVLPAYKESLVDAFPNRGIHRVVVDCGNGSMSGIAVPVLANLSQDAIPLYCEPDGTFPHRDPNPAVPSHLKALQRTVRETGADLGVAYDGDGDRAIFCSDQGRIIAADRLAVVLADHILQRHPGSAVVYDQKCSSVLAEAVQAAGGRPIRERSGYAFIKTRMIQEDAVFGAELSGHYFFGTLNRDDGLYATLLLLQALDRLGLGLSEAMARVPQRAITPDIRIPCPPDKAQRILDDLKRSFVDLPISTLDGVRIEFESGWALARLSVTEPLITLRFEAQTSEDLEQIQDRLRKASPLLQRIWSDASVSALPSVSG